MAGITPERHPTDRVNRMKTTLHTYYFDLNNPNDRESYVGLCTKLKSTPGRGRWMNCISMDRAGHARACTPESVGSREVELEADHLFDNQWNTATERLFDWYEEIVPDRLIKYAAKIAQATAALKNPSREDIFDAALAVVGHVAVTHRVLALMRGTEDVR